MQRDLLESSVTALELEDMIRKFSPNLGSEYEDVVETLGYALGLPGDNLLSDVVLNPEEYLDKIEVGIKSLTDINNGIGIPKIQFDYGGEITDNNKDTMRIILNNLDSEDSFSIKNIVKIMMQKEDVGNRTCRNRIYRVVEKAMKTGGIIHLNRARGYKITNFGAIETMLEY